jgi:translation elongation factor EF-Tu-like GTPase
VSFVLQEQTMERLLSIVEDVFEIAGRGCVIVPGIPTDSKLRVKVHDRLRLVRPDGTSISTRVAGIEMINVPTPAAHPIPILLSAQICKTDVPIGTQVFLLPVA